MTERSVIARQRTGARVLDGALELFNRDGASSVTTNHIAAHIGISPGNLYYWYADKSEIIRALFARLVAERSAYWEFGAGIPAPGVVVERLAGAAALCERYRFLIREVHGLVHADAELRAVHAADRDRRRGILTAVVRSWRADGILRPLDDADLATVVDTVWVLTESWVAHAEALAWTAPGDGARLLRAVLGPHLRHGRLTERPGPPSS